MSTQDVFYIVEVSGKRPDEVVGGLIFRPNQGYDDVYNAFSILYGSLENYEEVKKKPIDNDLYLAASIKEIKNIIENKEALNKIETTISKAYNYISDTDVVCIRKVD
jgi:hypothetical protein